MNVAGSGGPRPLHLRNHLQRHNSRWLRGATKEVRRCKCMMQMETVRSICKSSWLRGAQLLALLCSMRMALGFYHAGGAGRCNCFRSRGLGAVFVTFNRPTLHRTSFHLHIHFIFPVFQYVKTGVDCYINFLATSLRTSQKAAKARRSYELYILRIPLYLK